MLSKKPSEQSDQTRSAADRAREEETIRFNANLPQSLHEWLRRQAFEENRSMKEVTMDALSMYREEHS